MTAVMDLPTGAAGAALMTATVPCTVPWCTDCAWDFDEVGGKVYRMHYGRNASDLLITSREFPPGDPENDDRKATGPVISLPQPVDDHLSIEDALELAQTLLVTSVQLLGERIGEGDHNPPSGPTSLFSTAVPAWSVDLDFENGEVQYHRYAGRREDVIVLLEQVDYIDVTDSVVQLIRRPAIVRVEFETAGEYETPTFVEAYAADDAAVDRFRDGWMPDLGDRITPDRIAVAKAGVVELLAAYDGAVQR